MYTSGLVMTLDNNPATVETALKELIGVGPFRLGERRGRKQAVVLETDDPQSSQGWHEWASSLPGIEQVEVVFVGWERSEEEGHE